MDKKEPEKEAENKRKKSPDKIILKRDSNGIDIELVDRSAQTANFRQMLIDHAYL